MYLKIFKPVYVHYSVFFFVLMSLFAENRGFYLLAMLYALLHECAHASVALLLSEKLQRLNITPCGFELKIRTMSYKNELWVVAAGPFLSGILCLSGYAMGFPLMAKINLVLLVINLVPALPLDGGRLVRLMLWRRVGMANGNAIVRRISRFSAAMLFIFAFFPSFSPWLILISLLILTYTEQSLHTPMILEKDYSPHLPVKWICVSPDTQLLSVCRVFSPFYYTMVFVPNFQQSISEDEITGALKKRGAYIKIKELRL